MVLSFRGTEQRSDDKQTSRGTARPRRGRRRRWPVLVAAGAAVCAALAAAPGKPGLDAVAQINDASLPWDVASASAVEALSEGAPPGATTLSVTPVSTAPNLPAGDTVISGLAANGIPDVALNAYRVASARMANSDPGCGIDWSLLAGIGRVESNHGRFDGATLNNDGSTTPKIIGPALDGGQFAYIGDTDGGAWDGDRSYDRAVGPMQFIPTTWRAYAVDGDGNGTTDPTNINDAALGAAHYLCVAGGDLRTSAGQRRAVLAYNHSDSYVAQVLALAASYASGLPVADLPLVGDTSSPVPAPSGFWGAPAAPGPVIGAGDTTSSPSATATTYPAGAAPAAAPAGGGGAPAPEPAPGASGGGSSSGSASDGASGSGTGSSAPAGGGGSAQPPASSGRGAPAPAPAPAPAAPAPLPVPLPAPPVTVPAPTVQVPAPAPVPQVRDPLTGLLVDAVKGVTCGIPGKPACP